MVYTDVEIKVSNQVHSEDITIVFIMNGNDIVTFPGDYNEYFEGVDLLIKQHTRKTKLIDINHAQSGY